MAQRLRALAAAPEVKFSFRHPHRQLNSEALGDLVPSSGVCGHPLINEINVSQGKASCMGRKKGKTSPNGHRWLNGIKRL